MGIRYNTQLTGSTGLDEVVEAPPPLTVENAIKGQRHWITNAIINFGDVIKKRRLGFRYVSSGSSCDQVTPGAFVVYDPNSLMQKFGVEPERGIGYPNETLLFVAMGQTPGSEYDSIATAVSRVTYDPRKGELVVETKDVPRKREDQVGRGVTTPYHIVALDACLGAVNPETTVLLHNAGGNYTPR